MTVHKLHPANDPDHVLEQAIGDFDHVLIIGVLSDDHSVDARGTTGDKAELLYWIEMFKHRLLSGDYD